MTKEQKAAMLEEITSKLQNTTTVYLTDYSGLTVDKANKLRNRFREAGIEFRVLKNTLVRLAMQQIGGYDQIFEHLNGPTAVAFTIDPSSPARVIKKFLETSDKPQFKAAFIEGAVYGSDQLDVLANLKSKNEIIGDVIGLLLSPIANVVGAVQGQGSQLAAIVQTLAEREG